VIVLVFQIMKGLSITEVGNLLSSISESQAYDSEEEGDDDAEDNIPIKPSTPRSPMKRPYPKHDNGGTSSARKVSSDCEFSSKQKYGFSPGRSCARKQNAPNGGKTIENRIRLANVGNHLPVPGTRRCCHCSTKKNKKRSTTA
jgi:hypothetical protein